MTSIYQRLSQLIPGCLYLEYNTIQATILGNTVNLCSIEQNILLWITLLGFSMICFVSSAMADSNVTFISSANSFINKYPILKYLLIPWVVHAGLATIAFLVIVIFNPPTFNCLFQGQPDTTLAQVLPILTSTFLISVYGMLFDIPNITTINPTIFEMTEPSRSRISGVYPIVSGALNKVSGYLSGGIIGAEAVSSTYTSIPISNELSSPEPVEERNS